MEKKIRPITFNIYADTDEEAEIGRKAIIQFINILGQHGAKVSGNRLAAAVSMLTQSPFIFKEIIGFFRHEPAGGDR